MSLLAYVGEETQHSLNRLAGTLDANGTVTLDAQAAANRWAGTQNLDLLGALNAKNGSVGLGLNLVIQELTAQIFDAQEDLWLTDAVVGGSTAFGGVGFGTGGFGV